MDSGLPWPLRRRNIGKRTYDWVWPKEKIAIVEDWSTEKRKRKHLRDRVNLASAAGWTVFVFTPDEIADPSQLKPLVECLKGKQP